MRVLDDRSCYMTALQQTLIKDLFSLSTSVYTEVSLIGCGGNGLETRAKALMTSVIRPDTLYIGTA